MYVGACYGPMFAGKTSYLETKHRQFSKKKENRILGVKPLKDTRNDVDHISTHNGYKIPAIRKEILCDINVEEYDVILIDEAQWFPDLYSFIESNMGKNCRVYVAGLDGDIYQKKFGQVIDIIPFCSEKVPVVSVCDICGDPAPFSKRRGESSERDVPGGAELYYTVCSKHLCSHCK